MKKNVIEIKDFLLLILWCKRRRRQEEYPRAATSGDD
jgi:hypothetical protein